MDAADERSTRLGRRRREDPGAPAAEEPIAPPPSESGPAASGAATRLGSRRSGGTTDEATAAPATDTHLGARQHRAPATAAGDTAPTSLGARRRTADGEMAPPATAATSLGRRRSAPDDTPAELTPVSTETSLGARRRSTAEDTSPEAAPVSNETSLGERGGRRGAAAAPASRPGRDDEVVRFGPGVPPAAPAWNTGRIAATKAKRERRRRSWLGGLLTLALLAAVLAFLLMRQGDPMTVQSVRVDASLAPGTCDTVVDVVGTVATNGRAGTLRYQWQRSDGETTAVLSQSVSDKTSTTQVHLQWSVSGRGRFPAQAILRVLEPTPMESAGGFTYSCS